MRLLRSITLVSVCTLVLVAPAGAQQRAVTIGVVLDGPIGRSNDDRSAIQDEMIDLLSVDFLVLNSWPVSSRLPSSSEARIRFSRERIGADAAPTADPGNACRPDESRRVAPVVGARSRSGV